MKKIIVLMSAIIFLSTISIQAKDDSMDNNDQIQSKISSIIAKLNNNEIGKVEIIVIPARLLTRTRITPEMMEKQYVYKLTIKDIRSASCRNKFYETFASLSAQKSSRTPDIRLGVIFYNINNERLDAIYFDKSGNNGVVGNDVVILKGNFFKWLTNAVPLLSF